MIQKRYRIDVSLLYNVNDEESAWDVNYKRYAEVTYISNEIARVIVIRFSWQ